MLHGFPSKEEKVQVVTIDGGEGLGDKAVSEVDLTSDDENSPEKSKDSASGAFPQKPNDFDNVESSEPDLMEGGDHEPECSRPVQAAQSIIRAMVHSSSDQETLDSSRSSLSPLHHYNQQEEMDQDNGDPDGINIINIEYETEEDETTQL